MKLGVSLAGGGIKGAAHIGVLKAMEEKNVKIDMISGASSGSIVAALYAIGYKIDEIYEFFLSYAKDIKYADFSNIFKLVLGILSGKGIAITGLTKGKALEEYIREKSEYKNIKNITDIKFPLYISSVNLTSGDTYIFTNSYCKCDKNERLINDIDVATAVRASCSYPGVFEPVKWRDELLIDGGICENIPWKILKKSGASKVISIVFKEKNKKDCAKNMINVLECSVKYLNRELLKYELNGSDDVIEINTASIGLLEHDKVKYLYDLGYKAASEKLKVMKYL